MSVLAVAVAVQTLGKLLPKAVAVVEVPTLKRQIYPLRRALLFLMQLAQKERAQHRMLLPERRAATPILTVQLGQGTTRVKLTVVAGARLLAVVREELL